MPMKVCDRTVLVSGRQEDRWVHCGTIEVGAEMQVRSGDPSGRATIEPEQAEIGNTHEICHRHY